MTDREILERLEAQREGYERLLKLSERQHACVTQDRTDELIETLAERTTVMEEISRLDLALEPVRSRWSAWLAGLDSEHRGRATAAVERIRFLLEQVTRGDRDDALILQQRKIAIGRQIGVAAVGRQSARGYASATGPSTPSAVDLSR